MALLGKPQKNKPAGTKTKNKKPEKGSNSKVTGSARHLLKALLPYASAFTVGLTIIFTGLAYLTVYQPNHERTQYQARQTTQMAAAQIQLKLADMQKHTQTIASHPAVISALQAPDPAAQIDKTEKLLTPLMPENPVVRIFPANISQENPETTGFAPLELIRKTVKGETPAPIAAQAGGQWQIFVASPVKNDDQILGATLVSYPPRLLQQALSGSDIQGFVQVYQSDKTVAKPVANIGRTTAQSSLTQSHTLPGYNWTVVFHPAIQQNDIPLWPLITALLLTLGACAGLIFYVLQISNRENRADLLLLQRIVKDVSTGRRLQPGGFRQQHFQELAVQVIQLFASKPETTEKPARHKNPATTPIAAPAPRILVEETDPEETVPEAAALEEATQEPVTTQESEQPEADAPAEDITGTPHDSSPLFELDEELLGEFSEDSLNNVVLPELEPATAFDPAIMPAHLFRAYDIRGPVGDNPQETITPELTEQLGLAIGSEAMARGENSIFVACDGRLSSPLLREQLLKGLLASGIDVVSLGMVPTPLLYFATHTQDIRSGIMVTGSHNPKNDNGFKIVLAGETLSGDDIQTLFQRIRAQDYSSGQGQESTRDIIAAYQKYIIDDIILQKDLKVVIDCGNGATGPIAPGLIRELGCDVIPLYSEVDGNFPNHHPDPGKPENLQALINKVREENADLGIAFDGDGDRVGLVTNTGTIIYPDRLLMLLAKDIVTRNPGTDIIFDVKCTRRLTSLISSYGGRPVMWQSGHSLIKKKMQETGALLGGEMSGHIFFRERWFGFDDGIYSAARLLEILSTESQTAEQIFSVFTGTVSTPELQVEVGEQEKFSIVERLISAGSFPQGSLSKIDGLRVDFSWGWGLVRASNTTPALTMRFEGNTEADLEKVQEIFRQQLNAVEPGLSLPF